MLGRYRNFFIAAIVLIAAAFLVYKMAPLIFKHDNGRINIIIMPENPMVDDQLNIKISGLEPYQPATIVCRMKDGAGKWWSSTADFKADDDGFIDPARQAPSAGTYSSVDSMGLLWSMAPEDKKNASAYSNQEIRPEDLSVSVVIYGKTAATRKITRYYMAPGVKRIEVDEPGITGVLYKPARNGVSPAVIVLGGSDGGIKENYSALLASHGFTALSLAYFGRPGLPQEIAGIQLEYVEKAMKWLIGNPSVSKEGIGIIGISKGGELALLSASYFPQIKAAVGIVPSGIVWQSPSRDEKYRNASSWSYKGEDIPFARLKMSPFLFAGMMWSSVTGGPISTVQLYRSSLNDRKALEAAEIPVERINGPVLLISGADDRIWPSKDLCEIAERRLKAAWREQDKVISYENAGHLISIPYLPTTVSTSYNPAMKQRLQYGGTPKGSAAAASDSWPKIVRFLEDNLH